MKAFGKITLALLLMLSVLVLAACGGETTPALGDTTVPETTEPPHEHAFGEWTVVTEATCAADGEEQRTCACGETESQAIAATGKHDFTDSNTCLVCSAPITDGETAIFIGNSFIYWGGCVDWGEHIGYQSEKGDNRDKVDQVGADNGLFAQLCALNGLDITVIDCTWGAHGLTDFTAAGCTNTSRGCPGKRVDLLAGLDLNAVEHVFISAEGADVGNFVKKIGDITSRFTNPETKFYYLNHYYTWSNTHNSILNNLDELEKNGITVIDWGKVAHDLVKKTATIENSATKYNKNTFVIQGEFDSHHQNLLSGYITAQMAYSTISGKKAEGQDYSFISQELIDSFITSNYYRNGAKLTTMDEVFASPADMLGIQKLIDQYTNFYKTAN